MSRTVNIHEAKTHLSRLLEEVAAGGEIVIAKAGKPVARLTTLKGPGSIKFGTLVGKITIPEDFNAPLPPEVLAAFQGE